MSEHEVVLRTAEYLLIVQHVQWAGLVLAESKNTQDGLSVYVLQRYIPK